jgi:two-component system, LytTR family, response regulator
MLKAVIVDDEILVLDYLKDILLGLKVEIAGEFTSGRKALEHLPGLKPDIIFLDIEMPGINGIELATELAGRLDSASIVFVTAYDKYAVEAFKLNALHYILKPVSREDIAQALARVRKTEVPASPLYEKIYVRLFGKVAIQDEEGNSLLKWTTQKTEEMFALLMLYGKQGIDKWSLIEKLWPLSEKIKVENTMYTTIYRMKKALQEAGIKNVLYNRLGQYFFAMEGIWCDAFQLETLYETFQKETGQEDLISEQLFFVYQGALFGSKDYLWGELQKYAYQNMFDKLCDGLASEYEKKGNRDKAEEIYINQQLRCEV